MPCPGRVNIPFCFEEYDNLYMSDNPDVAKQYYATRLSGVISVGEPEFAYQCVQCGKCLEKCPQNLDIPKILESVVEELGGPDLKKRIAIAKHIFTRS